MSLLSECISDLHAFDDGDMYEESDLAHVVVRLRKIAGTLMPPELQASFQREIDAALVITPDERERMAAVEGATSVFPGPFLSAQARRLAHAAESLRDDVVLGRFKVVTSPVGLTPGSASPDTQLHRDAGRHPA